MSSDDFRPSGSFVRAINEQLNQIHVDRVVSLPASRYSIEELTDAYNAARADYVIPMPMSPSQFSEYIDVYDLNLSASCVVVDTVMAQIVGLGLLGVRSGRCWISRFGVIPTWRSSNIGRMIIEQLTQSARQYGANEITMEMIETYDEGIALAEELGFVAGSRLIVGRRPPETTLHGRPSKLEGVTHVQGKEVLEWLRERKGHFDWHNDLATYQHVTERLEGIEYYKERKNGLVHGRVIFEDRKLQLSRITVQVLVGNVVDVTQGMLNLLHVLYPQRDAQVENISADDPRWEGHQSAGYFNSFCRIGYTKKLD
ncbi:MAG: GNAT superfamily N-acetyltransferase [Cellvibrionaceae bacterium]|jgi:GNAT superfamily N-acetyltransferase